MDMLNKIAGTIFILAASLPTFGKQIEQIESNLISIDGLVSADERERSTKSKLSFETWPKENSATPPEYETTIYMSETAEFLYIGIVANDPRPDLIRSSYHKRDSSRGDDTVTIHIDTFGLSQQAYRFTVNPLGGQSDDIRQDRETIAWNGFWESKGSITDSGYQVELKIPLENFRFPAADIQKWKINIERRLQRDNSYTFALNAKDRDKECALCQFSEIELFENAIASKRIELRPYVIATRENTRTYPYNTTFNGESDSDAGLDVKWSPTGDSVLNATLNPDFSQVEADDAQFSVNRQFSVFYSEKRTFFLEGEDHFNTHLNVVNTRNLVNPDYGIKYTGKTGNHSFGTFFVKDSLTNFILPGVQSDEFVSLEEESENFVVRYKNELGQKGYVGLLGTFRSSNSFENETVGIDAFYRPTEQTRVKFQHIETDNDFRNERDSGSATYLSYNFNAAEDWHWLKYKSIDEDFVSGMGFITQSGFESLDTGLGHLWHNDDKESLWTRIYLQGSHRAKKPLDSTSIERDRLYERNNMEFIIEGKNKLYFSVSPSKIDEYFDGTTHSFKQTYAVAEYELVDNLITSIWSTFGEGLDYGNNRVGDIQRSGIWASANISSELNIVGEALNSKLDYQGDNVFDADIVNLTVNYSLDFNHHLRLKYQVQDVSYAGNSDFDERSSGYQFLYLYEHSAYSTIYTGYSSNLRDDTTIGSLKEYNNYFFIKVNHVFNL